MFRAVMVCIGDKIIENDKNTEGAELLNLLCTILDDGLTADKKEQILEERFSIKKNRELKEGFETMCNLSYAIEEKGEAKTLVSIVENYMLKNDTSLEAACEVLGITLDKYNKAKRILGAKESN